MTPANDNGPLTPDQIEYRRLSISFSDCVSNLLRLMRGGGRTERLGHDLEYFGGLLKSACGETGGRSKALQGILSGVFMWHDLHVMNMNDMSGSDDAPVGLRELNRTDYDVCDAALRLVASQIDGNPSELSKSKLGLMSAINEWNSVRNPRQLVDTDAATIDCIQAAEKQSSVYFIHNGEAIKIGVSTNPQKRLASLQTSYHKPLTMLAVINGGRDVESKLHTKFDKFRLSGEWFEDHKTIRKYIDLVAPYPVEWDDIGSAAA